MGDDNNKKNSNKQFLIQLGILAILIVLWVLRH